MSSSSQASRTVFKTPMVISKSTPISSYIDKMRSKSPLKISQQQLQRRNNNSNSSTTIAAAADPIASSIPYKEQLRSRSASRKSVAFSDPNLVNNKEEEASPIAVAAVAPPPLYQTSIVTDSSEFILPSTSSVGGGEQIHIVVNQNQKLHGTMEGFVSDFYNSHQQTVETNDEKPSTIKVVNCSLLEPISRILFLGVVHRTSSATASDTATTCNLLMLNYDTKQILPIPDFILSSGLYKSFFGTPETVITDLVYNTSKKHLYIASSVGVCLINFANQTVDSILSLTTGSSSISCLALDAASQTLFIGGSFELSGEETATKNLCMYNIREKVVKPLPSISVGGGGGCGGPNKTVNCLYYWSAKKFLFVGGDFTQIDRGSAAPHFFVYDNANKKIVNNCFEDGFNDSVKAITMDEEQGIVYITGEFYETGKSCRRLKGIGYIRIDPKNDDLFSKACRDFGDIGITDLEIQRARDTFTPKQLGTTDDGGNNSMICELTNYGNCLSFHKKSGFLYIGGYFNMLVNDQIVFPEITNFAIFDTKNSRWFNFVETSILVGKGMSAAIDLMSSSAPLSTTRSSNTRVGRANAAATKNKVATFFGSYVHTIICDSHDDAVYIGGAFEMENGLSNIVRLRWNHLLRIYNSDGTTEIAQLVDQMTACKFFYLADQQRWSKIDFI